MVEKKEHRAGRAGRRGQLCRPVPMAPKETGYKAAQDATRLPNGQILPNIPPNSLFCVTLPASRMGRFCQTYHYTLSFALRYPLPERADSVKHITTLFPLRYPTRFRNGQTRPSVPPHSFFCVTLPASRTGKLCQTYHHTLSFALPYPLPERADSAKNTTTLFPFALRYPCPEWADSAKHCHNTLSFVLRYPLPEWADSAKRTTLLSFAFSRLV